VIYRSGGEVASAHSVLGASASGYQSGWPTLIPDPSPAMRELYITHKSTYGQRYLPSPPRPPLPHCGRGAEC
jgi:hypothetical protein